MRIHGKKEQKRLKKRYLMKKFNICFLGDYDKNYIRNDVLLSGLSNIGHTITECHTAKNGMARIFDLYKKYRCVKNVDILYVATSDTSRALVIFFSIISRKPIVWDAFYSLYDSWVFDRGLVSKFSIKALYYWILEYSACKMADIIVLDTYEHIAYFERVFGVSDKRCIRVLVGAHREKLEQSLSAHKQLQVQLKERFEGKRVVYFHGKFIPLQGVEYIVRAAEILKDDQNIIFVIVGKGQTYDMVREQVSTLQLDNIYFEGRVPYEYLSSYIAVADLCLGIFGDTDKATRVIPSKIYEYAAVGAPILTADTIAIREIFNEEDLFLCNRCDSQSLANAIKSSLDDTLMLRTKASKSHRVFTSCAETDIIARTLTNDLKQKLYD